MPTQRSVAAHHMDRLIGIIREGGALTARLTRQLVAPDFRSAESVARAAEMDGWYEVFECPLAALGPGLFPLTAQLAAAWAALGCVSEPAADTLAGLRLVLAASVLGRPTLDAYPATPLLGAERRAKPTAAHPRAYQGTKHRPPREKGVVPVDLRPALCGTQRLDILGEEGAVQSAAEARLPEPFRTSLYPLVRHQTTAEVSEALALYWALGLDHDPARLAAAAYLFSLRSGPDTAAWCRFVAALPEEGRTPSLHLLAASGASAVPVQDPPPSSAEQLAEVLNGMDPLYRAYWLLHGLTTGVASDYLLAGFRLADTYGANHAFHEIKRSGYFPVRAVDALWRHLTPADGFHPSFALTLWRQCGEREGLGELVEAVEWTQYPSDTAYRFRRLFSDYSWDDLAPEASAAKWPTVLAQKEAIETLLRSVPEDYQRKCLLHLEEYLWQWDTPVELAANMPAAYVLTQRLCRPPFDKNSDPSEVLTDFLAELSPTVRERFLNAPDTSFRRLEEACRRTNDTWLVGRGTFTLTRTLPPFSVRCFEAYPALLLKVAKLLGCLPRPVREAITSPFRASPLFGEELAALPPTDAAALVEAHRDPQVFHPVPPKLREHLAGVRTLAPAALARSAEQMGHKRCGPGWRCWNGPC